MSEPKSLQPKRSAVWPTFMPIVTQLACRFGTLSSTMRAIATVRRYSTASVFCMCDIVGVFSGCSGQQMNAVNPFVRACTSRTRSRCSMRSASVSPMPYIMVTEVFMPS